MKWEQTVNGFNTQAGRVLIMTAVNAEKEAILQGIGDSIRFDVQTAGVGPITAAIHTVKAINAGSYDLVISAGIGGGFTDKADIGSIVISSEIVSADQGVETQEGFRSLDELEFGHTRILPDTDLVKRLSQALSKSGIETCVGPIVTVSTATGTSETAVKLMNRVSGVAAEAMEGFAVAAAANSFGIPVIEIRAISNAVGPRDREAWRIKEALDSLRTASTIFSEVF
jgi:futalosine hydrolase